MSIRLTQLVWKSSINLLPTERLVLLFLSHCTNDKNNSLCFPSIKTISKSCNLSKRHVQRLLRNLEELNILQIMPQISYNNNQKSNIYSINVDALNIEGGVTSTSPPHDIHVTPPMTPMSPYKLNDNSIDKKENNIKESPTSVTEQHPSSVLRSTAKLVLSFLKEKSGREYREVDSNIRPIISLLKEGITLEQLKQVIVRKEKEWGNNKEMQKHLCVKTLFRKSNFYGKYLPELVTTKEMKKFMKKD